MQRGMGARRGSCPTSSAMLTDFYQLTMAYAYFKTGIADLEAAFHLSFRESPFGGGFALAAGLEQVLEYLADLSFAAEDLEFLGAQTGNDGQPLFDDDFLDYLGDLELSLDVDAVTEGTPVFPREPLLRVTGPILQCQIVETALLNAVNFQTLIATKAARVCRAARHDPVVDFGLRRAQGPDGGVSASRATYIGGCAGTSNVLAAQLFGIPAVGTHAHSWVMAFETEAEAFEAYAAALPNNCTFLVDTYDTLEGVRNAVATGRGLRDRGFEMIGVRIDSGDLAWFSQQTRKILNDGGFPDAKIVASSELDEYLIESLKEQGAAIDLWGVGTKLVTAHGQPALGGVYKLSAIREAGGDWQPRIKVSEQTAKVTTPGLLQTRRFVRDGRFAGDMVYDEAAPPGDECVMVDPLDSTRRKSFCGDDESIELLVPVMRGGDVVYDAPPLGEVRAHAASQLALLDDSVQRFLNPHVYPVGIEKGLYDLRTQLIMQARGLENG